MVLFKTVDENGTGEENHRDHGDLNELLHKEWSKEGNGRKYGVGEWKRRRGRGMKID